MCDEQERVKLNYAEALAAVAQARMKQLTTNTWVSAPPHPELADVLHPATQVKLVMANTVMAAIGRMPGDLPVDQTISYHIIRSEILDWAEKQLNMRIRSDFAPFVADYTLLLQGGKRLPYPDQNQRFYDGLIDCFLTEAEMVLTVQYFYGLKLDDPGLSESMFESFKRGEWTKAILSDYGKVLEEITNVEPEELDEFVLSGLNSFSFNELHARLFLDHYVTMIRAQWDKLILVTSE